MTKFVVAGAGMAGLLAGNLLGKSLSRIAEAAPNLPNNHSAVLRFRSTVVADSLGIPFKKVQMMKAVAPWRNPVADAMAYSRKTSGIASLRSSISASGLVETRYIAPPDLINQMFEPILSKVSFDDPLNMNSIDNVLVAGFKIISTIPMPTLIKILGYQTRKEMSFTYHNGYNIIAKLDYVDAYCTLYIPNPSFKGSRISITGDEMVIECYEAISDAKEAFDITIEALSYIGLRRSNLLTSDVEIKTQKYGKITPIDDDERKRFIMWASDKFDIYSFGRFATWRPGLLLDDLVSDYRVISRLVIGMTSYDHRK
jgi:hypothetical protein